MDILKITIGKKTYSEMRFPAYLYREVLRLREMQVELAKTHKYVMQSQQKLMEIAATANEDEIKTMSAAIEAVSEKIFALQDDIYERTLQIICKAYGEKFSVDELEQNLSVAEINAQIAKIADATNGIFEKN
jgi:uncharacterized small protein (DUF1192 family)